MDIVGTERNFASLAVKDLLEARDLYHWHMTHKKNVVGTAVGLYFIRCEDPWPSAERSYSAMKASSTAKPPRTFGNSEIRDYSWPCVLVLVDSWAAAGDLSADDVVPETLFMPDGRSVPVCVVQVDPAEPTADLMPSWVWPSSGIGGGLPIISDSQGAEHVASVGTLVTDGHTIYALTSRHVTGPDGTPLSTILRGTKTRVGHAASRSLTRVPFQEVYPDFTAQRTYLTLDAGLIEVDDIAAWTSQTYGLPPVGELADLSEHNIGTHLVGAEVVAFGAASGLLQGRIAALFFRYKSLGGYDDVTDFLIAPSPGTPGSQPGDSGTVWHLRQLVTEGTRVSPYSQPGPATQEPGELLHPIAIQWGGQNLTGTPAGANGFNFALAASLTCVLRLLDVDLVLAHNTHAQPFWGKTGHYTIASLACGHVTVPKLKSLLAANSDRISFHLSELDPKQVNDATKGLKNNPRFVPLADVPDLVWKNLPHAVPGGRDTAFRAGPEHPTHFADIDQPRPADGKTLRQICVADPSKVTVPAWQEYYTALGHTASKQRGLLPFRVWQFFDEMTAAAAAGDSTRFVCAAGLVAHYVGDACQPLHGSFMADGIDATPTSPSKGEGVHSAYESDMVDAFSTDIVIGLQKALTRRGPRRGTIATGQDAAVAVVKLMDRTAKAIPPLDLVDGFAQTQIGTTTTNPTVNKTVLAALWQQFGDATIAIMVDGTRTLAAIWDAAFTAGGGPAKLTAASIAEIPQSDLRHLYEDPAFVPSLDLDHIAAVLT